MFEFTHNGETIKFEGYSEGCAIRDANAMFPQKKEGVWVQSQFEPYKFKWVEGNFFD